MGVIPLMLVSGADAEMRDALGAPVYFGMLGVTVFGLVLTPVFDVVIRALVERRRAPVPSLASTSAEVTP